MIILSDPRVAAKPVVENGEELVDLREIPDLRTDGRQANGTGEFALVRREVMRRLVVAQNALPSGLRLLVIEGYRRPAQQRTIFDGYRVALRQAHPDWPEDRLHRETSKFASPMSVAPHVTGGAVDVTLCDIDGVELDLGTAVDDTPEASANACFTTAENVSEQARRRRRVLAAALGRGGLVNYPTEWWHWSYGDRYWALLTGAAQALYGPVSLDEPHPILPTEA